MCVCDVQDAPLGMQLNVRVHVRVRVRVRKHACVWHVHELCARTCASACVECVSMRMLACLCAYMCFDDRTSCVQYRVL